MPTEQKPDILIIRTKTIQSITTTTKDGQTLWDYTYDYDKNGNRIQKQGIQGNTQYTYDSLQRLQEVHYPTGIQEQYTYDNAGNRALRTYGTKENFQTGNYVEERYHYDVKNNLKEKKTNESITSYTYDNQGNTISESVQSYLNAAEKDNSYLESYRKYTYNAFNQTETVTVETYQGEEKQVHTQKNCYDAENMRYGIEEDGESTYFITNG